MSRSVSTSSADVLLWFARNGNTAWNPVDGKPIYETRGLTHMICQRLSRDGFLKESHTDNTVTYTASPDGLRKAKELMRSR